MMQEQYITSRAGESETENIVQVQVGSVDNRSDMKLKRKNWF